MTNTWNRTKLLSDTYILFYSGRTLQEVKIFKGVIKWKEKLDNTRTKSGSAALKKRKASYIELLWFLDVVKELRISSGNISSPVGYIDSNENSCDESSTNTDSWQTVTENSLSPQTDEVPGTSQIPKRKTSHSTKCNCSDE